MSLYVQDNEWGNKYPHFQKSEFTCPCCGSVGEGIASSLLEDLEILRNKYGAIIITSGYRCPSYNASIGGVSNSAHLKGQASDIYFTSGITNNQNTRINIVEEIKTLPNYHYAYCNVNGDFPNMGNAIHMDTNLVDTEPIPEPIPEPVPESIPEPIPEPVPNSDDEKESLIKQLLRKLIELLSRILGDK